MPLYFIKHKLARLFELGPHQSLLIASNKIRNKIFVLRWKRKALEGRVGLGSYSPLSFPTFTYPRLTDWQPLDKLRTKGNSGVYPEQLEGTDRQVSEKQKNILTQANLYTQNIFDILGSGPQQFTQIPWHQDFRLKAQNSNADYIFDSTSFYKDISIKMGQTDEFIKDIKVPWELSRFQHLVMLGQAYEITNDTKYAQTFIDHIQDWLEKNPYMLGINWVNPMEVGIRAINWIWAWHYFKDCSTISSEFWDTFSASLYNHMHYLENNWEIYDGKTSNHYLSDLIGYFYLCWFFKDTKGVIKKRNWCYQELLREFDKQIFDEGSDYESTAAYHTFVTEIFDHFVMLCEQFNLDLSDEFHAKHACMHEFIWWCKINDKEMVKIGDDDSGRLLNSELACPPQPWRRGKGPVRIKNYPNFGLSIFKNEQIHLTLRHHSYKKKQPSAHFHNDALSITLAVNGIPIIIDPGSYIYTPSKIWRNHFRSAQVHNTFFIKDHEPIPFNERLFALNIQENTPKIIDTENILYSQHNLYNRFGLQAHRSIQTANNIIIINDWWSSEQALSKQASCWNFTLHPEIVATNKNGVWLLSYKDTFIACMKSNLVFTLHNTFVSLHYGTKTASSCLRAQVPLESNKKMETIWEIL